MPKWKSFSNRHINDEMCEGLDKKEMLGDFFYLKFLCMRLMESSYLLKPFEEEKRASVEDEMEKLLADLNEHDFTYAVDSLMAFNKKTGPLNLYANEWLADLMAHQGMTEESQWAANIETRPYDIYRVKLYDAEKLVLETSKGEELSLPRDSFNDLPDSTLKANRYLLTALTKYRGVWQANGISTWTNDSNIFQAKLEQEQQKNAEEATNRRMLEANGGHPLLYFKDYDGMHAWLGEHIGFDSNFKKPENKEMPQYLAVFIPSEGNPSILPDAALVIKDERNPYYNPKEAAREAFNYVASTSMIEDKMLHYLIEHHMLPDASINSIHGLKGESGWCRRT